MRYLYTGELDLTKQQSEDIFRLLTASDELLLEELFIYLQGYLIEKRPTWIQQNLVFVLHTAFRLAGCKELQNYCIPCNNY